MDKLKEKLENYSEPVPTFGWEQLEKELVSTAEKRIIYPYRRWVAVAAVAILLIASSVSVYFLNSPVADEIRYAVVPELPAEPDHLPLTAKPNMEVPEVEPVKEMRPIVAVVRKNTKRAALEPSVLDGTTLWFPLRKRKKPLKKQKRKLRTNVPQYARVDLQVKINCICR